MIVEMVGQRGPANPHVIELSHLRVPPRNARYPVTLDSVRLFGHHGIAAGAPFGLELETVQCCHGHVGDELVAVVLGADRYEGIAVLLVGRQCSFSGPDRLYLYFRATLQHLLQAVAEPATCCGVDGRQVFHPDAVVMVVVPLPVRGGDHINLWLCCHLS